MNASSTLIRTSSRQEDNRLAVARVAAAGRVAAERRVREAKQAELRAELDMLREDGQYVSEDGMDVFCFICSRPTDHWGEHTPEQIAAWKAGR